MQEANVNLLGGFNATLVQYVNTSTFPAIEDGVAEVLKYGGITRSADVKIYSVFCL